VQLVHEEKHRHWPFAVSESVGRGKGIAPGKIEGDHDGLWAQLSRECIGRRGIGRAMNLVARGPERGFHFAPECRAGNDEYSCRSGRWGVHVTSSSASMCRQLGSTANALKFDRSVSWSRDNRQPHRDNAMAKRGSIDRIHRLQ